VHKDSRRAGIESKQRKETTKNDHEKSPGKAATPVKENPAGERQSIEDGKWKMGMGDGNWAKKLRNRWGGIPSVEVQRGVWGRRVSRGPASGAPVRHASGVRDGGDDAKERGKRRARRRRVGEGE
jgi:hypothetical protein